MEELEEKNMGLEEKLKIQENKITEGKEKHERIKRSATMNIKDH